MIKSKIENTRIPSFTPEIFFTFMIVVEKIFEKIPLLKEVNSAFGVLA